MELRATREQDVFVSACGPVPCSVSLLLLPTLSLPHSSNILKGSLFPPIVFRFPLFLPFFSFLSYRIVRLSAISRPLFFAASALIVGFDKAL